MNLRPRRREDPEVNLTPLIDVVFLMLIFFMVSTTFVEEANIQVSLPAASAQPAARAEPIEVTVNQQGTYFLDNEPLRDNREETLRQALMQRLKAGDAQERQLVIRADERTEHLHIVTALDAAGRAGIHRVAIATIPSGQ